MIVSTWNNGSGSCGVKISMVDRGNYFKKDWSSVYLTFEGSKRIANVNVGKKSFWTPTCGELISQEIKDWLTKNGLDNWPYNHPYLLELKVISGNNFLLCKPTQSR